MHNTHPDQPSFITALLDPARYPHAVRSVRLIETHISWVLLAGRYAYKIKKPVDLGFLDFSTLARRRHFCAEEVRLNARLAPQLYREIISIAGTHEDPHLGGEPAFEYAVKMRRFPASREMDRLVQAGKIEAGHIDRLAGLISNFHQGLPAAEAASTYGSAQAVCAAALQNFDHLRPMLQQESALLERLRLATQRECTRCTALFTARRAQGYVRECHGDLHLGNIVLLGDEPVPFDCIEFNPDLRWIDTMNEIAFTVMDLQYRGCTHFASRFLNRYLELGGDYEGLAVLPFYLAYRATVRAKVAAIRAQQAGQNISVREQEKEACRQHLQLAVQALQRNRPALIITHGLPGSGKSTFAQMALERYGAIRIRSDVERKRLFGLSGQESSRSTTGTGIYTAEATRRTYERLQQVARQILAVGYTVIVDAAFLRQDERERFRRLATELEVPYVIASLSASESVLQQRIVQRQTERQDASEADVAVLKTLQAVQQPLGPQEQEHAVLFANEGSQQLENSTGWETLEKTLQG